MIVHVEVTQDDLDNGVRCDPCKCAAALGMSRVLPPHLKPIVGAGEVFLQYVRDDDVFADRLLLDSGTNRRILDWDRDKPVKPFSFDLDVPDDLLVHEAPRFQVDPAGFGGNR